MMGTRWARPIRAEAALVALLAAVALALGGCGLLGGGKGGGAAAGGAPSASASSSGMPADQAAQKIMGTTQGDAKALASSRGTLDVTDKKSAVTAEILDIHAYQETTQVAWRLKNATGGAVDTASFQLARPPLFDTRQLGLVDTATSNTYRPFTFVPMGGVAGDEGRDTSCVCGDLPDKTDATGGVLYAELPALPEGVTSVSVTIPGFKTMTGVPVSR